MLRRAASPKRNERCWCGSGRKYKFCCLIPRTQKPTRSMQYIDSGEEAIRYVICNARGTGFFSTKDNKIIVFPTRADAFAIATLPEFESQEPGEINVAGVGPEKWQQLQNTLPFVEVDNVETAVALVQERIAYLRAQQDEEFSEQELEQEDAPQTPEEPEQA